MKAYKATYNLKCRDHQFEINETYSTDTLEICESGFHFCKEMSDVLNYYDFNNEFVLLEVEILGDTQYENNKGVTDKLKVLRIVPEEEWTFMTLNEKGDRCVNCKNSGGYEWWIEYDVDGNETYYKDSAGYGYWREYDVNGNETYYKDSAGYEYWTEYDVNGNEIHCKSSGGFEYWREYDVNGKVIHCKDSNGYEWGKSVKN